MQSLFQKEGITVSQLADFLKKLLEERPDAKNWKVNHIEFGGITSSHEVSVDEGEEEIYIS